MMRALIFLILLGGSLQTSAAPIRFPDHNFSVEIPAGWMPIRPLPPEALAAVQSPDASKKLLVFATKYRAKESSSDAHNALEGARETLGKQGWKIDPERPLTLGGQPFVSRTAHIPTGGTMTAYATAAGDQLYMLQTFLQAGDATRDPDLQSIVQSFTLLSPPPPPIDTTPLWADPRRAGRAFGNLIVYGSIFAVVATLIRRLIFGRRNA